MCMGRRRLAIIVALLLAFSTGVSAQKHRNKALELMFSFGARAVALHADTDSTNIYTKYTINIARRNMLLASVPTMYYLVRDGKRNYFSESYTHAVFENGDVKARRNLHLSTIYNRHNTLPSMVKYLTPRVYDEQLFEDGILSPINHHNRRFYRYSTTRNADGTNTINIRSRYRNTQLIRRGYVVTDGSTGQVISFVFEGEFDMVHSVLRGIMGTDGDEAYRPSQCDARIKLSFLGNKILAHFYSHYGLPTLLPDSVVESDDRALMDSVRPLPLTVEEKRIIAEYDAEQDSAMVADSLQARQDSIDGKNPRKRHWAKAFFWDVIGDNMLNRIKATLGDNDQGSLRISPLFNPLYFGYSKHKGFIYRFDVRGNYNFTDNRGIFMRLKMGYSFKQKQFFFKLPVQWDFNKRRNGFVRIEWGNGNRITNSQVLENVKRAAKVDSIDWNAMNLDYFRDMRLEFGVNYDVIKRMLGVQVGFEIHHRSAVDKSGFIAAGRPTVYKTFAPFLQLQYRPLTDNVPLVLTTQYEHGMKALGGSITYDRFEFDGQYIYDMTRMRSWQLRAGLGFYTARGHEDYFLDYGNFQEDYIPSGWGDKWTGEFELLNSNWYNASDYYFRTNATYESPLLLLSHVPLIGQIIEKERIYISALAVRKLFPYVEAGYGFTNRVFSMGIFTGFSPSRFEGVGLKFGFELFNNY